MIKVERASTSDSAKVIVEAGAVAQSIPNVTGTTITNWTEEIDNFNTFNATTGVFTVPAGRAGKYRASVAITFNANGAGFRSLNIRKNTTAVVFHDYPPSGAASNTIRVEATLDLAVGDTLDTQAYQSSGAALSTRADAKTNRISIEYVGP